MGVERDVSVYCPGDTASVLQRPRMLRVFGLMLVNHLLHLSSCTVSTSVNVFEEAGILVSYFLAVTRCDIFDNMRSNDCFHI